MIGSSQDTSLGRIYGENYFQCQSVNAPLSLGVPVLRMYILEFKIELIANLPSIY